MISDIATVAVPVDDTDEAIRFYCEILGMEKRVDAEIGDGVRYVEVAPPGSATALAPYTWYRDAPAAATIGEYSRVVLRVDHMADTYRTLSAHGVEFASAPSDVDGAQFASMKDPWGNIFVLTEQRD